jgi:Transposase DDE domain
VRRQTVEHPFGTIKAWMGATHFQMRRLTKVASEMALHVLAYKLLPRLAEWLRKGVGIPPSWQGHGSGLR